MISVVALEPAVHDVSGFDSGDPYLDRSLRSATRGRPGSLSVSRTYVIVESGLVTGYYALSPVQLRCAGPDQGARRVVDGVNVAGLAVDTGARGRGLGSVLLADALRRCVLLGNVIGLEFIVAWSGVARDGSFFLAHGFRPINGVPGAGLISVKDVRLTLTA